ncbi:MAG TPA: GNAT family N-acetyltransferase [Bacillota bacterium]|nr:GNAT family N-acetyltransferase [Bacillota bacterium]HOA16215.1 GNAT family N-acetyltransferase [Bacillota bacterium]HOG52881.1 GNAT family N-acetyltransferase [Bacillota bacterium]
MEGVRIVQLTDIDDAEVASTFDRCWQDTEPSVLMHGPQGLRRVSSWLDVSPRSSALLYERSRPVGVILTALRDPNRGYIASLAVDPEFRGKGYGRRLMQWGLVRARTAGCRKVSLHVFENNVAALSLYRSLGFAEVRRIGHWEGLVRAKPTSVLTFEYRKAKDLFATSWHTDMAPLWENEPASIVNLGENVICLIASKDGKPCGYLVYSTRSLCWILDFAMPYGTSVQSAAELILQVPTARFLPAVFTTVPEGGENERLVRGMGLKRERSRLEMQIMLSQDAMA